MAPLVDALGSGPCRQAREFFARARERARGTLNVCDQPQTMFAPCYTPQAVGRAGIAPGCSATGETAELVPAGPGTTPL